MESEEEEEAPAKKQKVRPAAAAHCCNHGRLQLRGAWLAGFWQGGAGSACCSRPGRPHALQRHPGASAGTHGWSVTGPAAQTRRPRRGPPPASQPRRRKRRARTTKARQRSLPTPRVGRSMHAVRSRACGVGCGAGAAPAACGCAAHSRWRCLVGGVQQYFLAGPRCRSSWNCHRVLPGTLPGRGKLQDETGLVHRLDYTYRSPSSARITCMA